MNRYQLNMQIAVALSLLLHVFVFGAYQVQNLTNRLLAKPRSRSAAQLAKATAAERTPTITFVEQPKKEREPRPNVFVETDERQETPDKPGPTPYYSTRNTSAANPENPTRIHGDIPYLDGAESKILSTEDVPLPSPGAMAISQKRMESTRKEATAPPTPPAPPPPPPAEKPKELPPTGVGAPKPVERPPATMAMVNKPTRPGLNPQLAEQEQAAAAGQPAVSFPGRDIAARKSQLKAAGVGRTGIAAFNVAGSPFGAYDKRLIATIQRRWQALIDERGVYEKAGTVTVYFELYEDGSIRNLSRKENTAGEILALFCEKSITDSAPFEPLTDELRRLVGNEPREVNLTFYY